MNLSLNGSLFLSRLQKVSFQIIYFWDFPYHSKLRQGAGLATLRVGLWSHAPPLSQNVTVIAILEFKNCFCWSTMAPPLEQGRTQPKNFKRISGNTKYENFEEDLWFNRPPSHPVFPLFPVFAKMPCICTLFW